MPAVALARGTFLVALKHDFGGLARWPKEWTVSVRRPTPYRGPIFGLFDPTADLRQLRVDGLAPDLVFGAYRDNLGIPLDPGARSGVIRALVPVDVGTVGAKRRALSGVGAKRRVWAHAVG